MLNELLSFIKLSFRKRLALYDVVVLSFTLFGRFPNLLVKYVAFAVFVGASVVCLPIFASQFVSYLRLVLAHRNRVKIEVSREIAALARQMKVQIKELGFVKGCTAYVWGKSLVLGIDLLKRITFDQRQAVVAHELAHIKHRHVIWRIVLTVPLLAIPYYCWLELTSPIFLTGPITFIVLNVMATVAMLAYVKVIMVPGNWVLEARADKTAAEFIGKEHIRSALLSLADKEKREIPSETHPSISERVRRIEELGF